MFEKPILLIKVSEKREYLEALSQGQIYMNESGYFRKLEDSYRGDPFDGKQPITPRPSSYILIGDEDSPQGQIKIPAQQIISMERGFMGDDKIPLFCCSLLSEKILEKKENYEFRFKSEFISEMKQFGKYAMIFRLNELISGLRSCLEPTVSLIAQPVSYVDIAKEYDGSDIERRYSPFFKKDYKYYWQNEWRVLLTKPSSPLISPTPWEPLIGPEENHLIITIPHLTQYIIMTTDELSKQALRIKADDTHS